MGTNKLRVYAVVLGGVLAVVSLWAAGTYDGPLNSFLLAAGVGVAIAATPYVTAYAKLLRERRRHATLDQAMFISPQLEIDRDTFLERTATALRSREQFGAVKRQEFPEGRGLIVNHTAFHGTFVRLSEQGEAIVTGIKADAASAIVDELEQLWSHTFSPCGSNPFAQPIPVRGLPRGLLTIGLTVVIILDAAFLVGLAYPAAAYNPGEKATLVGYDIWADADPGADEVDAQLAKAGFLISVLNEEATEIRWQAGINNSSRSSVNDAATISADITGLLDAASNSELDSSERARLESLRTAHENARDNVREAMVEPAPNATEPKFDGPFSTNSTATDGSRSSLNKISPQIAR